MSLQRMRNFSLTLLTLAALGGASIQLAAAQSGPTHAARQVLQTVPAGPQREVFGFALASSLSDPTVGYTTWDLSLVSTVAFFGLHVQNDGTLAGDAGSTVWNSSQLTNLVGAAHAHGTKVVLTIILQDFATNTPNMCGGLNHVSVTIPNAVAEMRAKGVDGINVDYEGLNGSCGYPDPSWARHAFTNFLIGLRSSMPAGSYLSVDTYASSATDSVGFFDISALNASVDSFFVMAYDLEYSNYARPPASCSTFCLGPTGPVAGYYYTDTSTADQYRSVVAPSKVILGVPYYGRKACVASPAPNAYPTSSVVADTYLDASTEATSNLVKPGSYVAHRDANDGAGQERWDTWVNTSMNCTRELYFDDTISLGNKYALVNADNLRGVGIWNLNYGGGAPELWSLLSTYFACPTTINVAATQSTTSFGFQVSAGKCTVAYYDVQAYDSTLNEGWFSLPAVGGGGASSLQGFAGHTYQLMARAHSSGGMLSSWAQASTQVAASATKSHAWSGLYTLDAFGGIHLADSPPLGGGPSFASPLARAVKSAPGAGAPQNGLILDGYGGLHAYGGPTLQVSQEPYYPGNDIARDFVILPDASGGYELDGYGGIHPFALGAGHLPAAAGQYPYFPGRDLAKKITLLADGSGGYVLDAYGGLHPWSVSGHGLPSPMAEYGYWGGLDIARDVWLAPGSSATAASGYVLDGYGGVHPFWSPKATPPSAIAQYGYWTGRDVARSLWFLPGATASTGTGYTLDGFGGIHPFAVGGQALPPAIGQYAYWPGRDVARILWGA